MVTFEKQNSQGTVTVWGEGEFERQELGWIVGEFGAEPKFHPAKWISDYGFTQTQIKEIAEFKWKGANRPRSPS